VAVSPSPVPAAAPEPATVLLDVRGAPAGARLLLDGVILGQNPIRLPRSAVARNLRVDVPGRAPIDQLVVLEADPTVLTVASPPEPARPPRRAKRDRATPILTEFPE
jgi:hypothetical protein